MPKTHRCCIKLFEKHPIKSEYSIQARENSLPRQRSVVFQWSSSGIGVTHRLLKDAQPNSLARNLGVKDHQSEPSSFIGHQMSYQKTFYIIWISARMQAPDTVQYVSASFADEEHRCVVQCCPNAKKNGSFGKPITRVRSRWR